MSFSLSYTFNFDPETSIGGSVTNIPISSEWTADGPNAPEAAVENGELVYLFSPLLAQQMTLFIKVPQTYVPQRQINLYMSYYTPSTIGTVLIKANAYLIRRGVDAISSVSLVRATTNTANTNLSVANLYTQVTLDITSSTGTINSTTVLAGDMIRVDLLRDASDSDIDLVRVIPSSTEASYA